MAANASYVTLTVVLMLGLPASGLALDRALDDYVIASWTEKDGLPAGDIRSIVQDRDGYLWLGTSEGLYRFDGVRFVSWDELGEPPLLERRVLTLLSASDGSLWIALGGSGGISRIRAHSVTHYGEPQGIDEGFIRSLAEDRQGVIWACGRGGLYKFAGEAWTQTTPTDGLPKGPAYDVYQDTHGDLWVSAAAGLYRRGQDGGAFQLVSTRSESPRGFSEDAAGTLWATDPVVGFRAIGHHSTVARHSLDSTRKGSGVELIHDRRDNLWVATSGEGLWRVGAGVEGTPRINVLSVENGLSDDSVRALLEDREGNIWVGTQGGLHRFSPRTVAALTGLGLVRALEVGDEDGVWVATASGLIRIRQGVVDRRELSGMLVSALHQDVSGTMWIGTNQGLYRFANQRFSAVASQQTRLRAVASISSSPDGTVWLCDREQGLFVWRNGELATVEVPIELRPRTPYAVHVGQDRLVWTGFSGGMLSVMDAEGRFTLYELPSGLRGALRSIYEDGDTLWLAGDDGLMRFTSGQFVMATRKNGLPDTAVSSVLKDEEGYLWAGTASGIVRLHRSQFELLAADPSYQVRYSVRDASDGVAGHPFWRGNPSAVRGTDGRLWFVTTAGVTVVDPHATQDSGRAPRARIEAVLVRDRRLRVVDRVDWPPRTRNLEIEYTALGSSSSTKVRFRYRLDGVDAAWVDAGSKRKAVYTNLGPGRYRFRVVATTTDGVWHQSDDAWEFSIQPSFYQTNWFYALCATALLLLAWAVWQLHMRRVRHEFSVVLAERVRLSREIHDTLLQNLVAMALHFESLARNLAVLAPTLKDDATRIRREIEDYIRETRHSVWALRSPDPVPCDLATMLEETGRRWTAGSGIRFDFTFSGEPRRCPAQIELQLLRIGQEAIHNAVRHAGAAHIRVSLLNTDDVLCLRVSDDGCGFDAGDEQEGDHCGLRGMRERADQIGGQLRISTGRRRGTEVEVIAPQPSGAAAVLSLQ